MKKFRRILLPFSVLYGIVIFIRNFLYDFNIIKSNRFNLPTIVVGNLSVGGTGKTPQIEYLIRLLSSKYKIATLSRGYKRKSKGFILANKKTIVTDIGDEPFQYYSKFSSIQVAVDNNRSNGIKELLKQKVKPEVVLLDDAYQHRKLKAGFYILLTDYNELFINDYILPAGNLREGRSGAKRADVIIVTKCPSNLSKEMQLKIKQKLDYKKEVFFSFIAYDDALFSREKCIPLPHMKSKEILLIAGIAKPAPFLNFFKEMNCKHLLFKDHHEFTQNDINYILEQSKNKIIVTTEKDYVRLEGKLKDKELYFLPIQSKFISNKLNFDQIIYNYIEKNC